MTKTEAGQAVDILKKQDFRECRDFPSKSLDVGFLVSVTWIDGGKWQSRQFTDYSEAVKFTI